MSNNNPHALENLPPLDRWTNEALVADFAAQVTLDHEEELPDLSPASEKFRAEILRRMSDNRSYS